MTTDPRVDLAHIVECIKKIERFSGGGKAASCRRPWLRTPC
jgi:hypothetical protein